MNNVNKRLYKLLICFFFGIATGIPWVLIGSTLNAWLAEAGVTKTTIGVLSSLAFPYMVQFLWAPLIDRYSVPTLGNLLGHKRAWLMAVQPFLALSIVGLGLSNPIENIYVTAAFACLVSFFASTQEIIINSYRISILAENEQGVGASTQMLGWRIGNLICGGLLLLIIDYLCKSQGLCKNFINWSISFALMAATIVLSSIPTFFLKEEKKELDNNDNEKASFQSVFLNPVTDFMKKDYYILILIFLSIYRLCDYFIAPMTNPFLIELGFSLTEIGLVAKTFGFVASIVGALLSGVMAHYCSMTKALVIAGILEMVANIMFIIQAKAGYNLELLYLTIGIENICGSIAATTLMVYISSLCTGSKYSATQYSLLSGISLASVILTPGIAGLSADIFGWVGFFKISMVLGVPPIILILIIQRQLSQRTRRKPTEKSA